MVFCGMMTHPIMEILLNTFPMDRWPSPHFLCTLPKIWPSHIHHIYNIWNHHPGAGHLCRSSVCLNGAWWPTLVYLNILNGAGEVFPWVHVFLGQTTQIVVVSCWLWILFLDLTTTHKDVCFSSWFWKKSKHMGDSILRSIHESLVD